MSHDDATFDEVKGALGRADQAPDDVIRAAKDAFTWRTIDAELAELVFDSALDELTGVRAATTAQRQLTFQTDDLELEIMVDGRRIVGQVVPPRAGSVEIAAGGDVTAAAVDDLGSFQFDDVPPGHVRLSIRVGDKVVVTEWTIV